MTRTLYLITEDKTDVDVFERILQARGIKVNIRGFYPPPGQAGISRLVPLLKFLIESAQTEQQEGECIVVLHDADEQTQPHNRQTYNKIAEICASYGKSVHLIIARDEIESWILADAGLCTWLGIKPENQDEVRKPSEKLNSLLQKTKRIRYTNRYREEVLKHLNGATESVSLKSALQRLTRAGCL